MFSAHPTEDVGDVPTGRRRPGGVPAVLHHPGPLHRGRRDEVRAVDDHRRAAVRASRGGLPGRDALPLGDGDPAGRRQAGPARPRRPGRRRLAALRFRRPRTRRPASHFRELCDFLASDASPISRFTPEGADPDSVIDVRAIFQQGHATWRSTSCRRPAAAEGRLRADRLREGVLPRPDGRGHLRPARGQPRDRLHGRRPPDQYVAHVLPLHGHEALSDFFAGILIDAQ